MTTTDSFDAIYFSPHLDDAALSCGGQIYLQATTGKRVLIVTVAAGWPESGTLSKFARRLHKSWGLADQPDLAVAAGVVRARRAEDAAACHLLGAAYAHWALPDCIYRAHPQSGQALYDSEADIFGPVDPAEQALVHSLAEAMAELPAAGRVLAPLGIGNHVDHQLVRRAAEACYGRRLYFYEDYPYVQREPGALWTLVDGQGLQQAEHFALTGDAITARLEAIMAYQSQIPVLFGDTSALRERLFAQIEDSDGERLWGWSE
jgi:LmbE family N-acetylglucosaminyl deacetylase